MRILYHKPVQTLAMKHGISLEPRAKQKYISVVKSKHRSFSSEDTGLTILKEHPFVGASPDLEVNCICCGKCLVEIKCPFSIKDDIPSDKLDFLHVEDNSLTIKKSHKYYSQMQGQMGVTGRQYCDFFVYTHHGYHLERVQYDSGKMERNSRQHYKILV